MGYGRFDGVEPARVMARLYAAARLYASTVVPEARSERLPLERAMWPRLCTARPRRPPHSPEGSAMISRVAGRVPHAIVGRLAERHPEQFGKKQHSTAQRLLRALR